MVTVLKILFSLDILLEAERVKVPPRGEERTCVVFGEVPSQNPVRVCLSVCLPVCLYACLSVSLSVGLSWRGPDYNRIQVIDLIKDLGFNIGFIAHPTPFCGGGLRKGWYVGILPKFDEYTWTMSMLRYACSGETRLSLERWVEKNPFAFFTELRDSKHPLKLLLLWWRDHWALWRSCAELSDADLAVIKNIEETFGDGTGKWPPVKTEDLVYWVFEFMVRVSYAGFVHHSRRKHLKFAFLVEQSAIARFNWSEKGTIRDTIANRSEVTCRSAVYVLRAVPVS
jgi:hypothetical protein